MTEWFDQGDEWEAPPSVEWEYDELEEHHTFPYQRILLAIEDNEGSSNAIKQAIRLARYTHARLIMLMVPSSPLLTHTPDGIGSADGLVEALMREGEAILSRAAAAAQCAGVSYTTILKWGCSVPTILDIARQTNCDLIIMGGPPAVGWERFLRPRHAKYVAARASQPVLVIKAHPSPRKNLAYHHIMSAEPELDPAIDRGPRRLLLSLATVVNWLNLLRIEIIRPRAS